jgi:hypothetical protein
MAVTDPIAPARFCTRCGRARHEGARFCVGCGRAFDDAAALLPAGQLPLEADQEIRPAVPYPVAYSARRAPRASRASTGFRLILAAPHIIGWLVMFVLSLIASLAGWLSALALGRQPALLHRFQAATLAYVTRVAAYLGLVTDRWPPFPWQQAPAYPVQVDVAAPAPLPRLRTLVIVPLAVPAIFTSLMFGVVAWMLAIGAWFAILATGRLPGTIADMQDLAYGFQCRTLGYVPLLLTGVYPWYESGPLVPRSRRERAQPTA